MLFFRAKDRQKVEKRKKIVNDNIKKYTMNSSYLTAIIIFPGTGKVKNAAKYRNIKHSEASINRFLKFVGQKFPNWEHVNFYDRRTKNYLFRVYSKNTTGFSS